MFLTNSKKPHSQSSKFNLPKEGAVARAICCLVGEHNNEWSGVQSVVNGLPFSMAGINDISDRMKADFPPGSRFVLMVLPLRAPLRMAKNLFTVCEDHSPILVQERSCT